MKKVTIIKPSSGWKFIEFKEVWWYRDFLYFLTRQQVLVKYKQTVMGGLWAILQPLFSMLIFTIFFGKLAKMPNDNIPYPLFYYSALAPWGFFSASLTASGGSLTAYSHMVTKVYFPRIILPIIPVIARLVDFFIALLMLFLMMIYYGVIPGITVLFLPILILIMMLAASGAGMWLTALNIKYRDVQYTIGFLVQALMFGSPVVYPYSLVPENYKLLYALNPMVGVIEGFRSILVGSGLINWNITIIAAIVSIVLFISGAFYFQSVERLFADVA